MRTLVVFLAVASTAALAQPAPPQPQQQAGQPAPLCGELQAWLTSAEDKQKQANPSHDVAVAAPPQGQPRAMPGGNDAPQAASGLSGQVQPSGPGASGPQGQAQQAPAPQAPPPAPQKTLPEGDLLQAVHAAASGTDPAACRDAVQKIRRTGVPLPPALLALGALDLRFQKQQP